MGLLKNAVTSFAEFWKKPQDKDLSKLKCAVRPAPHELDAGLPANEKLLEGIYTGSNQDFALSSYLAMGMVDVPKNLVGIPTVVPDEGQDERLVKELMPLLIDEFPVILQTMLIQGTAWRWPRWSDKLSRLTWEAIPDSCITNIILDLDTGEISELWCEEQIKYNKGESSTDYAVRTRHITKTMVTEEWKGTVKKAAQYKNVFGFLPVPFGHNCSEGKWRGNSVFGRVLRWMKASHDIAYNRDEILSRFKPKIVQTVKDVKTWIHNNTQELGNNDTRLDPFERELFVNQEGESTSYLSISGDATSQHTIALQDNERKIMKGSGIPEMFFGAIASGNYASAETDRLMALDYIKGLRREITRATQEIVNQSLKILAFMRFTQPPQVSLQWSVLTMSSESEKVQKMSGYASSIVNLLGAGAISKEGAFYFTKELFPDFPVEDPDHFMAGITEMMTEHSSKVGQPLFDMGDFGAE